MIIQRYGLPIPQTIPIPGGGTIGNPPPSPEPQLPRRAERLGVRAGGPSSPGRSNRSGPPLMAGRRPWPSVSARLPFVSSPRCDRRGPLDQASLALDPLLDLGRRQTAAAPRRTLVAGSQMTSQTSSSTSV